MTVSMGSGGSYVGLSWKDSSESSIHNVINTSACTLYAPLKSSLILSKGAGDPTWSRATKAWGFNELGYLEELASGCAFFGGARLVRNAVSTKSEDVSNAAWVKTNCTITGTDTVVCANETSAQSLYNNNNYAATLGYLVQVKARLTYVDTAFVQFRSGGGLNGTAYANFDLVNGIYSLNGVGGIAASIVAVSAGVYDCIFTYQITNTTADTGFSIGFVNGLASSRASTFIGNGVKSFGITRAQVCDVTNYDASYVPEYVSVGVVASPYFGAGIDGARYFETDWQGAPIAAANLLGFRREAAATNNLLFNRYFQGGAGTINQGWFIAQGSGADLVTNGEFATDTGWTKGVGWTISGGTAVATAVVNNQLTQNIGAVAGKTYTITFTLGAGWSGVLFCAIGGVSSPIATTRANAAGTYSFHCIAGSSTPGILYFYPNSACTGTIDNVSVRESVIQVTQATGLDGIANTATTLTFTAADAIILQPISLASAARCASAYVKRRTGTGTISFTQDGGSTWTDITSQINSSTWSRVEITSTLANPSVGFKGGTLGDEIYVDCVQNEAGAKATSPIVTTTAAVTRDDASLKYQTASNIDFAVGSAYFSLRSSGSSTTRYALQVGDAYTGFHSSNPNTAFRIYDGTTVETKSGLDDATAGIVKRAISWGGATQSVTGSGAIPQTGAFDGSFGNGATITIGWSLNGYIGPVAIYNYQMTDAELQAITS